MHVYRKYIDQTSFLYYTYNAERMQHFLALRYVVSLKQNERKTLNDILSLKLVLKISSVTYNYIFTEEFMPRMCPPKQ